MDQIRYETLAGVRIGADAVTKRLASTTIFAIVLFLMGLQLEALLIAGCSLVIEAFGYTIKRDFRALSEDLQSHPVVPYLLLGMANTVCAILPPIILASQDSIAAQILAYLVVFGLLGQHKVAYADLPFYFWFKVLPIFGGIGLMLATSYQIYSDGGSNWLWLTSLAILTLNLSNLIDARTHARLTRTELEAARQQSAARLRQLEHYARHDALTGILNRKAFDEGLAETLRQESRVAVLLMDLDGFKPINDNYGHRAGDLVLCEVAERLKTLSDTKTLTARLGGDEFAMIVWGWSKVGQVTVLADQVSVAVPEPIDHEGRNLSIGVSIGIATCIDESEVPGLAGRLCSEADQAMYRAKSSEGTGPTLFEPAVFAPRLGERERTLYQHALSSGQIRPFYQPIVSLETRIPVGYEALARWVSPQGQVQSPSDFIPDLYELGLQSEFAYAISRQVLRDVTNLLSEALDPGRVAINIPEITLATRSGQGDLNWLLAENEAARRYVTLEVTENVFTTRSSDMIQQKLTELAESGVRLSLDDFGTGHASFQHLNHMRFDELKIDASFIHAIGRDPTADVILEGLLSIARGLSVDVVAEGVESELQARTLVNMGCKVAQGYLFGAAKPFSDLEAGLKARGATLDGPHPTVSRDVS